MGNLDRGQFEALAGAAVRAPSSHHTQRWLFRHVDGGIEVFADRTRASPGSWSWWQCCTGWSTCSAPPRT
jgi:nitroreductase